MSESQHQEKTIEKLKDYYVFRQFYKSCQKNKNQFKVKKKKMKLINKKGRKMGKKNFNKKT